MSSLSSNTITQQTQSTESHRPQFHFAPQKAWINDPNGLVYYDGEYHMFYQYHPESTVWGPMHWGHAVSSDLLHWQELPIALYPDDLGAIFSGSAVIDWHNTAGFGKEAMIAIFTHAQANLQQQSIAYSNDKGRTWTKYQANPVLPPPAKTMLDFRDPKVFWYGNKEDGHWVMAVAAGSSILFFTSSDLKAWQASGSFGVTQGATCGVWETPDLFELPVSGSTVTRWVLTVGIGDRAPAGGSGQQYFVGQFDGQTFTNDNPKDLVLWVDYGADFYAAQSWSDVKNRRIWTGWMNNWSYARTIPTGIFRGAMNLPRELSLSQTAEGIRLIQTPIKETESLRKDLWEWQNQTMAEGENLLTGIKVKSFEIYLDFELNSDINQVGLKFRKSETNETVFSYEPKTGQLFFERGKSGITDFSEAYSLRHVAPLSPDENKRIKIHAIADNASMEIFAQDGLVLMSEQFFAAENALELELFVEAASVKIHELKLWKLSE